MADLTRLEYFKEDKIQFLNVVSVTVLLYIYYNEVMIGTSITI